MTIEQARKLLGKAAEAISDEELQREIDVANLLKDLFFDFQLKNNTIPTNNGNK